MPQQLIERTGLVTGLVGEALQGLGRRRCHGRAQMDRTSRVLAAGAALAAGQDRGAGGGAVADYGHSTSVEEPPGGHEATSARVSTGCRKARRSSMTCANEAGATSRRSRARKARHWVSLSRAKLSLRPTGTCSGNGVRRRSKVRRMATAKSSPSNANVCAIVQRS